MKAAIGGALLVLVAVALRVWAIDFGLPLQLARPDEERIARMSSEALAGQWSPQSFQYPTLFIYGTALGRAVLAEVSGGPLDDRSAYLMSRSLSATAGVVTVLATFWLGLALRGRPVGVSAATIVALAYLPVRESHFGVTDATLTLGVVVTMALIVSAMKGRPVLWLAAGSMAGLSCSVKYPGLLLLIPLVAACLPPLARWTRRSPGLLLGAGLLFLLGFALGTPYAWLEPSRFAQDLWFEVSHKTSAEGQSWWDRGWIQHALVTLRYGLGLPVCLAGLVGMAGIVRRRERLAVPMLLFAGAHYGLLGMGTTIYPRYMLPLVPLIAILAGLAADDLLRCLGRPSWGWMLTLVLVLPSAARAVRFDLLLARTDTRVIAAGALDRLVEAEERALVVGRYAVPLGALPRDDRFVVITRPELESMVASDSRLASSSYLVWGSYFFGTGLEPTSRTLQEIGPRLAPLVTISPLAEGVTLEDLRPVLTPHDKFYLPYARFAGICRPGPIVHVAAIREPERLQSPSPLETPPAMAP